MGKNIIRNAFSLIVAMSLLFSSSVDALAWDRERESKANARAEAFTDISYNHWFWPSLFKTLFYGIMDGVTEKKFAPDEYMTRAMVVKTLHNYRCNWELRKPDVPFQKEVATGRAPFKDVKPDAWYAEAVDWAYEKGIIKGMGDDMFTPDAFVTREEMAVILKNYTEYMHNRYDRPVTPSTRFETFSDCGEVSPWARDAMMWATRNKIIRGNPAKMIEPKKNATRAEVGQMMCVYSDGL